MAKIAYTGRAAGSPDIGAWLAARAWPAIRATALPAAIVLLALLLRVFRLELQAWTPDTYEQMTAAHRLVSGQFPVSSFYPPGVAITLAPAFVFFPQTLATVQAVIIAASLLLVLVTYAAMRRATDDRLVPVLLALGVATAPQFVYFSRDGLFDVINAAWIVSAILAVPWVRRQPLPTCVAYGTLLAVAINIRATNPAFLPAIFIYWVDLGEIGIRPRALWRAACQGGLIATAASLAAAFACFAFISGSFGQAASGTPLTLDDAGRHVAYYATTEFGGVLAAPVMLILATLGGTYLWSRNRTLLYASIYMLTIFPLVHVPLPFANSRYMLPSLVFAMLLAAHAPAAVASMTARRSAAARNGWRAVAAALVLLVGAYFAASDVVLLARWPASAANADEASYRQLRPAVRALPAGSLLISGGTRGVRDSNNRIEYLDLIDYSLAGGNSPDRVDGVMDRVREAIDAGRPVYYLYTRIEGVDRTFAASGPGYQPYLETAAQRFTVTEVLATNVEYFTLYKIDAPR